MARLQSRAQNEQHDDVENVLQSFHEWMVKKAQADRNRKISSGRNDAAKENPYIPPTIASPGPSIVPNQQATIEEISGSKTHAQKLRMLEWLKSRRVLENNCCSGESCM